MLKEKLISADIGETRQSETLVLRVCTMGV